MSSESQSGPLASCEDESARYREFALAVQVAGHAIYMTDPAGVITYVNPEFEQATGFSPAEAVGRTPRILKSGLMDASYYDGLWRTILSGAAWSEEVINRRKDGSIYYALQTIASIKDDAGAIKSFVAIQSDITATKELELALARSEGLYRSVLSSMREGVILQDADGVIKAANPAAERILGLRRDQATGRTSADPAWQSIREDESPYPAEEHPAMLALKAGVQVDEAVMGLRRPSGELVWIAINARPVRDPDGSVRGVVTTFVDVSERKQRADAVRRAAETDFLTGLRNRYAMDRSLREAVARAGRYGEDLAVLFLDIDHFKQVNDRYGHDVGDLTLSSVAAAVAGALRAGDQAARWGGEEFIVAAYRADRAAALALAERLRQAVAALKLETAGSVTVSLGVALYRDGDDLDSLVGRADKALYEAKAAGRNRVVLGD